MSKLMFWKKPKPDIREALLSQWHYVFHQGVREMAQKGLLHDKITYKEIVDYVHANSFRYLFNERDKEYWLKAINKH